MVETIVSPENGETYYRGVRTETVRFGGLSRDVKVAGWYPLDPADLNGILLGIDLIESDRIFLELRSEYAARIKRIRKKLGLTQEEAGRIIGGGKRAFQKYESGKVPPSDAAIGLLELLDRHPEEIETLRALRG
jgi:HTH-type transcriptional regulator / antitoxin MqsA